MLLLWPTCTSSGKTNTKTTELYYLCVCVCVLLRLALATSGGACVLTADADIPPVTETAVRSALLHALDVVAELGGDVLREDLRVLAGLEVLLPIQEPEGDLELARGLDDRHQLFDLVGGQFTGALVDVDLGLLADQVRETAADTGDLRQSEHHIALSLHVGVQDTQNVLEFGSLHQRARPRQNDKVNSNNKISKGQGHTLRNARNATTTATILATLCPRMRYSAVK